MRGRRARPAMIGGPGEPTGPGRGGWLRPGRVVVRQLLHWPGRPDPDCRPSGLPSGRRARGSSRARPGRLPHPGGGRAASIGRRPLRRAPAVGAGWDGRDGEHDVARAAGIASAHSGAHVQRQTTSACDHCCRSSLPSFRSLPLGCGMRCERNSRSFAATPNWRNASLMRRRRMTRWRCGARWSPSNKRAARSKPGSNGGCDRRANASR